VAQPVKQNTIALNIKSPFPILKIGTRVFQIGDINYGSIHRETFIGILDLGLKFIPNNNINKSVLYYDTIKNIDIELNNLNKKLVLFNKQNNNPEKTCDYKTNLNENFNKINDFETNKILNLKSICDKLNRIKRKNNFEKLNFELNPEIVDLRFKIISDLPRVNNNIKTNINLIQFKTIINFNKTRPFQVIDTDKKHWICNYKQ
jgi:hypothetical protein